MRMCQKHWDMIRARLKELGVDHLGAKTGEEARAAIITEMEGRGAENEFDPLMSCNNMIFEQGLKRNGPEMLLPEPAEQCPICLALKQYEVQFWINGPTQAAYEECARLGLVEKK